MLTTASHVCSHGDSPSNMYTFKQTRRLGSCWLYWCLFTAVYSYLTPFWRHTCWFLGKQEEKSSNNICLRTWSHQHSEKLGNWCSRLYSRNSNMTLIIIHIHQSRIIRVWGRKESNKGRMSRRRWMVFSGRRSARYHRYKHNIFHCCKCNRAYQCCQSVSYNSRLKTLVVNVAFNIFF